MIKWLLAVTILLLAFGMNAAVLDSQHGWIVLLYGLIAVNVFALALMLIWLAAYFRRFRNRGFGIIGHALVYLAGGTGLAGLGHFGLSNAVCTFPSDAVSG
ncbi:MAG: hypothetical protein REI94_11350 [Moraxellaceae bacterium]|nr:hypothetical protein [Moraxellaceae bacterium]